MNLEILTGNQNILLIGKATIFVILGILIGFIAKQIIRKIVDKIILKNLFKKDINTYETAQKINKILTEAVHWIIIIIALGF